MIVKAIRCLICQDTVYSRTTRDFRKCSCGNVNIDGGFNHTTIQFIHENRYECVRLDLDITKKILILDTRKKENKFGLIRA